MRKKKKKKKEKKSHKKYLNGLNEDIIKKKNFVDPNEKKKDEVYLWYIYMIKEKRQNN